MKQKIKILHKNEFKKWLNISNLFAKSLCPSNIVVSQFNHLNHSQRHNIRNKFSYYDNIRRKLIPQGESDDNWITCVMVDAHIIATEENIDPLTAMLCVNPFCKDNEIIIIK